MKGKRKRQTDGGSRKEEMFREMFFPVYNSSISSVRHSLQFTWLQGPDYILHILNTSQVK